jgi:hypothetical protein
MSITTEIRRTVDEARAALADPKPFHAVAGAGDLFVERVRVAAVAQQRAMQSFRFDAAAVPAFLSSTAENVRGAIVGFPERAQDVVIGSVVQASNTYDDLAKRGAGLVRRVTRQRASQDLADQVENTVRAAKATTTTARNAASAATAAVSAAAEKTGTTTSARTMTRTRPSSTPRKVAATRTATTRTTASAAKKTAKATTKAPTKATKAATKKVTAATKRSAASRKS